MLFTTLKKIAQIRSRTTQYTTLVQSRKLYANEHYRKLQEMNNVSL